MLTYFHICCAIYFHPSLTSEKIADFFRGSLIFQNGFSVRIGLASHYGEGPVNLLVKEETREVMGQRHRGERQNEVGAVVNIFMQAVSPADNERYGLPPLVHEPFDELREGGRSHGRACVSEDDR